MSKLYNTIIILAISSVISIGIFSLSINQNNTVGVHQEGTTILGHVELVLYGGDGKIKTYRQGDNLVVTNGDNSTANRIFGTTLNTNSAQGGTFSFVAVGISGTAANTAQTGLLSQVGNHRAGVVTNGAIHGQAVITANFPANRLTNSTSIGLQEVGLFDSLSNSTTNLFARQTYSTINVFPSDTLQVTWTVTIT